MYHDSSTLPSFRSIINDEEATKIDGWTVWAIGVGSAMGGVFFGWEFVLYGGFISGLFAVVYAGVFYYIYSIIITELSVRYQSSGGSFDFVMDALGIRPAIVVAIMNMLKLICANAATVLAISSYMIQAGMPSKYKFLVWTAVYGLFTTLDCIGIKQSALMQVLATVLCVSIIVFYVGSNLSIFESSNLFSIPKGSNKLSTVYLFFKGLPFALQFFDGFEEIPLLFSYTKNAERTMPVAINTCYFTILLIALGVLVSASAASEADVLLDSEAPLMVGIQAVYGVGSIVSNVLACLIVIGLLVNFFAFTVYISQQMQAVAEANLLPRVLAYREVTYGAPVVASVWSMIIGLCTTSFFDLTIGADEAQNTLLMASLFPSMICYLLVLQCIVQIRFVEIKGVENFNSYTPRELKALGHSPPTHFKVQYATIFAKAAQILVALLIIALLLLALKSFEYLYGLLLISVVAVLLYLYMSHRARYDIRDEAKAILREHEHLAHMVLNKRHLHGQEKGTAKKFAVHKKNAADAGMGIGRSMLVGNDQETVVPTALKNYSSIATASIPTYVNISGDYDGEISFDSSIPVYNISTTDSTDDSEDAAEDEPLLSTFPDDNRRTKNIIRGGQIEDRGINEDEEEDSTDNYQLPPVSGNANLLGWVFNGIAGSRNDDSINASTDTYQTIR